MTRILVVDDEPHIVEVVCAYLEREGYEVVTAADGESALDRARDRRPELVVLDVMLPGRSGFDVLRDLRRIDPSAPAIGVIMLTARDELVDRVAGLELGADDYVTKPFEPRELVARVGAVLRRLEAAPATGQPAAAGRGAVGQPAPDGARAFFDLVVDPAAREVRRGEVVVALTRAELDLLDALTRHPGLALTREQLGERVFGERFEAFDRTIDSHVKNLRHKLGARPDGGAYVETIRGVGYRAARPAGRPEGPR